MINLYGPSLTLLTIIQTFRPSWMPQAWARNMIAAVIAAVTTVVAIWFASDFLVAYTGFIYFLSALLIPWSVINLVDYYVVKKGVYDPQAFIDGSGGYGYVNVPAVAAYVITFLLELPFVSTPFFVGPIAEALHGTDLTWVVGSVVSFVLYLVFIRLAQKRSLEAVPVA